MNITTKTTEEISTEIPHDVFARFLRSLGFPVNDDTVIQVNQPYNYDGKQQPIEAKWTFKSDAVVKEVDVIDDEDIQVLVGLHGHVKDEEPCDE